MFGHNSVMSASEHLISRVCDALAAGELEPHELTARRLGAFLGKTTSVLYHHWGSLDGFLYAVSQAGYAKLGVFLTERLQDAAEIEDVAEAFVSFGLDHPLLYHVMFERPYDWEALREAGAFERQGPGLGLWSSMIAFLAGAGSRDPDGDARILYAGIHGLVSLALSGRANVGALAVSDRDIAINAARRLARRIVPRSITTNETPMQETA